MTLERQSSASDCGVSCLLMIIRYYGGDISKEFLRVLTQTKKDGCDAYHLLEGARKLGFSCYGVRGDVMALRSQDFPCIAHVKNSRQADHFVVLTNVEQTSRRVMMLDPDLGKRILSYQEYQAISQNQYLLFQVERDLPHFRKISKMEQLIFRTVIQHWNFFTHLFAFSFLYLIFHTLMMYRFTFLSTFVLESQSFDNLFFFACFLLFIVLCKNLSSFFRDTILIVLKQQLDYPLITSLFGRFLSLPYLYYKDKSTGEILTRVNEMSGLSDFIIRVILASLDVLLIVISLFLLAKFSIGLFMITLLFLVVLTFMTVIFQILSRHDFLSYKEKWSRCNQTISSFLGSLESLSHFHVTSYAKDTLSLSYGEVLDGSHVVMKKDVLFRLVRSLLYELSLAILSLYGAYLVIQGKLSLTDFITFDTIFFYLMAPVQNIVDTILRYPDFVTSKTRMNELWQIEEVSSQSFQKSKVVSLEVRNLSYHYGKRSIFSSVSFFFSPGERVLISGPSGSGKSTFLKVLAGFLDATSGTILLDDKEKREEQILYVSSEEKLFPTSVYQNVVLSYTPSQEEFERVMNLTHADDISLSNGYETVLLEDGFQLSSGERTRLILARSLICPASVYLYDEVFQTLDAYLRQTVLQNLFQYLKHRIVIVVSHQKFNPKLFTKVIHFHADGRLS